MQIDRVNTRVSISSYLILLFLSSCIISGENSTNFPILRTKVTPLPKKELFWIYILAGQSNMTGHGLVEPCDTVANPKVINMGGDNNWYIAKEPLNYRKPRGLDCGLSFAKQLLDFIPDSIVVGLINCAVDGSSINDWLTDSNVKGVSVLTNFTEKINLSKEVGTIKGILWLQGESDTNESSVLLYMSRLYDLHQIFRAKIGCDTTPILIGELGSFGELLNRQPYWDEINSIINEYTKLNNNVFLVKTSDLTHNGDNIHFDSKSQRELGTRFAKLYFEITKK